ncbi:MAG: prepilin-type N-terminal cleavage/methylation domain-containing protein [Spirochaetes bacterium]|jgi:type II secretion system protein J|nr:prepilin-type N-terminal cleavage/methylation domain-containing protein [Spirochaetota bacterium]
MLKKITNYFDKKTGRGGFTLIEVLVAVAISSTIIIMIYAAHSSVVKSIHTLTGVADFYENLDLAIQKMDRDISCLYYSRKSKKVSFIGESNYETPFNAKFNFVTVDHNDFLMLADIKSPCPKSDIREIGYYLEPMEEVPGLFYLMRREQNNYDDEPETGGESNILLENVVDLKFEFKSRASRDWSKKIDSRETYRVPSLVKTTLVMRDYSEKDETFIFSTFVNSQKK